MEEILLVTGFVLTIVFLTVMTQFSKHIKLDSDVLIHSKLQRLPHLLDVLGRCLLVIGSTLTLPLLFLGFSDLLPPKFTAHVIVAGSSILLLAGFIIIPTTIWRFILFFGFNSLLQMLRSFIKNAIPTEDSARFTLLRLVKFCIYSFLAMIKICFWFVLYGIQQIPYFTDEETEKKRDDFWHGRDEYHFWHGSEDQLHIHIDDKC